MKLNLDGNQLVPKKIPGFCLFGMMLQKAIPLLGNKKEYLALPAHHVCFALAVGSATP